MAARAARSGLASSWWSKVLVLLPAADVCKRRRGVCKRGRSSLLLVQQSCASGGARSAFCCALRELGCVNVGGVCKRRRGVSGLATATMVRGANCFSAADVCKRARARASSCALVHGDFDVVLGFCGGVAAARRRASVCERVQGAQRAALVAAVCCVPLAACQVCYMVVVQWGYIFSSGKGGLGGISSSRPSKGTNVWHSVAQQVPEGGGVLACSVPLAANAGWWSCSGGTASAALRAASAASPRRAWSTGSVCSVA